MIKRIDPIAKSMAHNRRRTSTRVVQDKREQGKQKQDDKEIQDARESEYRKSQGQEATKG